MYKSEGDNNHKSIGDNDNKSRGEDVITAIRALTNLYLFCYIRSKREVYNFLAVDVGIYLPIYE